MGQILSKIASKKAYEIHIGCDSHKRRNQYVFAVVIAAYIKRRGGIFFFHRKRLSDIGLSNLKLLGSHPSTNCFFGFNNDGFYSLLGQSDSCSQSIGAWADNDRLRLLQIHRVSRM